MTSATPAPAYHHGNLREAVLSAAVEVIGQSGVAQLSLRDIARRAGVSHAAPAHHFGDKTGVVTAVAAQGFSLLADVLEQALAGEESRDSSPDSSPGAAFVEAGVAYVEFATTHVGHFEVMFQPALLRDDDPDLVKARDRAWRALSEGLAALPAERVAADRVAAEMAAWSLVHGFATLWLSGSLTAGSVTALGDDPAIAARAVARMLFA